MSRKMTEKKSTSKYRNKKGLAPIIPVIAIIEVLVLIAASTYAWYYLAANKTVETDIITVAPDSGLDIDFKNANTNDSINIWEYINDDFKFEPATSLDGRNIYFPTSGTFGSVDTSEMKFRDATINDINSKYINIDFELTNTNPNTKMEVYLNNSSYFYVVDNDQNISDSRALRLAFYPNDGSTGSVGSEMVYNDKNSDSEDNSGDAADKMFTVYFDNTDTQWANVYAFFYDSHSDQGRYPDSNNKNYWAVNPNTKSAWPGEKMTRISGATYALSFSNPVVKKATALTATPVYLKDEYGNYVYQKDSEGNFILDENDEKIKIESTFSDGTTQYEIDETTCVTERTYDTVIFTNYNGTQTVKLKLNNDNTKKIYKYSSSVSDYDTSSASVNNYSTKTIYFAAPSWWRDKDSNNNQRAPHAFTYYHDDVNNKDVGYSSWPGDAMKYLGSGIYSYEYNENQDGYIVFNDGFASDENSDVYNQTYDYALSDGDSGCLYYVSNLSKDSSNKPKYECAEFSGKKADGVTDTSQYAEMPARTIYFYNSYGWNTPYMTIYVETVNNNAKVTYYNIPLTSLTGNVYYATIPQIFTQVYFHAKDEYANANTRTKLLGSGLTTDEHNDGSVSIRNGYVYRPVTKRTGVDNGSGGTFDDDYYPVSAFEYANHIGRDGYAVISPGSSAGFQRAYSPVVDINHETGAVNEILPAFANSIDKYINNSEKKLLELEPNSMLSLSMIIWLEGTDRDCKAEDYASNLIKLRLEFSTQIVNQSETNVYTYRFYDKTNEFWTSDRITTESGQKISPVMQLYDETVKRGYLMKVPDDGYVSYNNNTKVGVWEVQAPRSIVDYGHDISFRRVNPYDEDEVWNYWHAGPCSKGVHDGTTNVSKGAIYKQAFTATSTGGTISFTAFGDGSPTTELLTANDSEVTDAPSRSCGGLWGLHEIHKLYVLDARGLVDNLNNTGLTTYDGALTVRYNYNYYYTVDSSLQYDTVDIEYRSSGYNEEGNYNSIFVFVMPQDIYDQYAKYVGTSNLVSTSCYFRKYQNFNSKYAMNSEENNRLTLFSANVYNAGTISGDFFEFGYDVTNADSNSADLVAKNYWGSDILYFQSKYDSGNSNDDTASAMYTQFADSSWQSNDGNHLLRVRFFANKIANYSGIEVGKTVLGENDQEDFYSILFQNDNFKGSGHHGFACVIPNDKQYYFYRVESCDNQQTTINNATKQIQLENLTQSTNYSTKDYAMPYRNYAHVTTSNGAKKSESICKFEYYFHTIYFQSRDLCNATAAPKCYVWTDNRKFFGEYPGKNMTYVAALTSNNETVYQYKIEIPSDGANMKISSTLLSNRATGDMSVPNESGVIFEYKGDPGSGVIFYPGNLTSGYGSRACESYENVFTYFFTTEWPHFNANSISGSADINY
jgi:hypothetical protein